MAGTHPAIVSGMSNTENTVTVTLNSTTSEELTADQRAALDEIAALQVEAFYDHAE